jgi:hypothetical protein
MHVPDNDTGSIYETVFSHKMMALKKIRAGFAVEVLLDEQLQSSGLTRSIPI